MNLLELLEGKNYQQLYHHTSIENLLNILRKNKLLIGKTGFISLTRNKNFLRNGVIGLEGIGTAIILNGSKLTNNYKLVPYRYHNLDINISDENEERTDKNILNILNYIDGVILYKSYFDLTAKQKILINRFMNQDIDSAITLNSIKNFIETTYKIPTQIQ